MTETQSFAAAKAARTQDSTDWTPEDCIREVLRLIELGEIQWDRVLIMGCTETPEGVQVERWRANMPRADEAYLLLIQQQAVVND